MAGRHLDGDDQPCRWSEFADPGLERPDSAEISASQPGLARGLSVARAEITSASLSLTPVARPTLRSMTITYEWRGNFDNTEVNALHAEGFDHESLKGDWWTRVNQYSLGWVCAREGGELVGFVNVAWDGAVHRAIACSAKGPLNWELVR